MSGKDKKGFFVVVDGPDGAGKTSVAKEVVKRLGWSAIYSKEPGGTPFSDKLREIILSEDAKLTDAKTQFALFWSARRDHLVNKVLPALDKGKIVIMDRFDSSTFAYQIVAHGNHDLEDLFWKMREVFLEGVEPDLYILLDVHPEEAQNRINNSKKEINHFDTMRLEFHEKVYEGLKRFIGDFVSNGHIVNARNDFHTVVDDVLSAIDSFNRPI